VGEAGVEPGCLLKVLHRHAANIILDLGAERRDVLADISVVRSLPHAGTDPYVPPGDKQRDNHAGEQQDCMVTEKLPNRRNLCIRLAASPGRGGGTQTGSTIAVRMPLLINLYSAALVQPGDLSRVVAELLQYRVSVLALIRRRAQFDFFTAIS
jgi:hypothetical protein